MFQNKTRRLNSRYGVVISISTDRVGMALVRSDKNGQNPDIIIDRTVDIKTPNIPGGNSSTLRQIRETLFTLAINFSPVIHQTLSLQKNTPAVTDVLFVVSAPWSKTIRREIRYTSKNDFTVTESLIRELTERTHRKTQKNKVIPPASMMVERSTVQVLLNGYLSKEPVGKVTHDIEITEVLGLIPTTLAELIEQFEEKLFPNAIVRAHTSMFAFYTAQREGLIKNETMTLVDVGREMSEFAIVTNDSLIKSVTIPWGINTLIETANKALGRTSKQTTELLTLFRKKTLDSATKDILIHSFKRFDEAFYNTFLALQEETLILGSVVLHVSPEFALLIKERIEYILRDLCDMSSSVASLQMSIPMKLSLSKNSDPNMYRSALFFHTLNLCDELSD